MIIVKLKGGLGNQMFQYALGRALSLRHDAELTLDTSFYNKHVRSYSLDVFNIAGRILKKREIFWLYRLCQHSKFFDKIIRHKGKEKSFQFDPRIFSLGKNLYLNGYWQSPKYFAGYEDVIRKDFTLKNSLPKETMDLAREINSTNSLCIHVRRGDYVGNAYHEVVQEEYYQRGIEYITTKTKVDKLYVFSDDIVWCEQNMKFDLPTVFVGEEHAGGKGEGHMYLMSQGRNFIIANSSFSWWAAWLCEFKDKIVVCPKQWFPNAKINTSDLIPKEWIRI